MLHKFLNTLNEAKVCFSEPPAPYLLLCVPRPSTRSSQLRFTAWLHLGIPKPCTSSGHLRWLYTSCRAAPRKTQVGTGFGLHHPGNPRACALRGQLLTTSEHHHPSPAQLILHGGQRLVVSGHSQSLQLTGLSKSLPLTSRQCSTTRGRCTHHHRSCTSSTQPE